MEKISGSTIWSCTAAARHGPTGANDIDNRTAAARRGLHIIPSMIREICRFPIL